HPITLYRIRRVQKLPYCQRVSVRIRRSPGLARTGLFVQQLHRLTFHAGIWHGGRDRRGVDGVFWNISSRNVSDIFCYSFLGRIEKLPRGEGVAGRNHGGKRRPGGGRSGHHVSAARGHGAQFRRHSCHVFTTTILASAVARNYWRGTISRISAVIKFPGRTGVFFILTKE